MFEVDLSSQPAAAPLTELAQRDGPPAFDEAYYRAVADPGYNAPLGEVVTISPEAWRLAEMSENERIETEPPIAAGTIAENHSELTEAVDTLTGAGQAGGLSAAAAYIFKNYAQQSSFLEIRGQMPEPGTAVGLPGGPGDRTPIEISGGAAQHADPINPD